MSDIVIADPSSADEVRYLLADVKQKVADLLRVEPCDVRLRIIESGGGAWTKLSSTRPTIFLPRWMLSESILAHEVGHCFIPVVDPFEAEGFATWAGCAIGGNCHDFAFWESSPRNVLQNHNQDLPSLDSLLAEQHYERHYFSPDRFHCLDSRLAHMVAAAACEFATSLDSNLPGRISDDKCATRFRDWIGERFSSTEAFEKAWRESWNPHDEPLV